MGDYQHPDLPVPLPEAVPVDRDLVPHIPVALSSRDFRSSLRTCKGTTSIPDLFYRGEPTPPPPVLILLPPS